MKRGTRGSPLRDWDCGNNFWIWGPQSVETVRRIWDLAGEDEKRKAENMENEKTSHGSRSAPSYDVLCPDIGGLETTWERMNPSFNTPHSTLITTAWRRRQVGHVGCWLNTSDDREMQRKRRKQCHDQWPTSSAPTGMTQYWLPRTMSSLIRPHRQPGLWDAILGEGRADVRCRMSTIGITS